MRYLTAFIVVFWVVMTALLVRLQVSPEGSDVLAIPPQHLAKLMFVHSHPSDLSIYGVGGRRVGSVALRPNRDPERGESVLGFSGNAQIDLPGVERQRVVWETEVRFDKALAVRHARLRFGMREPEYRLEVEIDPAERVANYALFNGPSRIDASTVSLTEEGLESLVRRLGFDPAGLKALRTGTKPPEIVAKRTKFEVRGEEIEAYEATIRQGEQVVSQVYVSQLGQILKVNTSLGFRFVSDDLFP